MIKEIVKGILSQKTVNVQLEIYSGFKNIDQLESNMIGLGIYEKQYVVVKFNNQFYGVVAKSADTAIVVGYEVTWVKECNLWRKEATQTFTSPFAINKLMKGPKANSEIIRDLMEIDPNFEVLNGYKTGWKNIRGEYQYALYMAELLCRTFYVTYFTEEDLHILPLYDYVGIETLKRSLSGGRIVGVNPFRSEALFLTGKTHRMLFQ